MSSAKVAPPNASNLLAMGHLLLQVESPAGSQEKPYFQGGLNT